MLGTPGVHIVLASRALAISGVIWVLSLACHAALKG
jgi:hypothetical protein